MTVNRIMINKNLTLYELLWSSSYFVFSTATLILQGYESRNKCQQNKTKWNYKSLIYFPCCDVRYDFRKQTIFTSTQRDYDVHTNILDVYDIMTPCLLHRVKRNIDWSNTDQTVDSRCSSVLPFLCIHLLVSFT